MLVKNWIVMLAVAGTVGLLHASPAAAQSTPNFPRGEMMPRHLDSGMLANKDARNRVVFSELIHTDSAHWTRLYFADVQLDRGSFIRVTSLLDGEVQELDAAAAAMWDNTTAYFNGGTVRLELIAGAGTVNNRVVLKEIAIEVQVAMPATLCGLCGPDDRTPSTEKFAGRLMPVGCSATIYNHCSCLVSAGHCAGANLVIQFNVPNSLSNCNVVNPPVADQFPVTAIQTQAGGASPGNDWAVMTTGNNNLGQSIYARYGEFRPIATTAPVTGNAIDIWGYGSSKTCTLTSTQQRSTGSITSVQAVTVGHSADATPGNSGSSLQRNNEIIGIVTHCPCPNLAQRIDTPAFVAARASLCTCGPPNNTCANTILVGEGVTNFNNINATTTGPDESALCNLSGDTQVGSDIWFGHIAQCTGTLTVSLCGSSYATKLALYTGPCPTQPNTAAACDLTGCPTSNRSEINFPVTAGQSVRIRIGGHFGSQGNGILTISCTPAATPCPADLNNSGAVDVQDLLMLLAAWGPCVGCPADLNGSNVVDVQDLLLLLAAWGPCP
ncbi:MAG TPA: hypothetical protein PK098_11610 [Phycisphaerales bacterium]|nr:hypothetical protein [Phycisphaerales bacterium]